MRMVSEVAMRIANPAARKLTAHSLRAFSLLILAFSLILLIVLTAPAQPVRPSPASAQILPQLLTVAATNTAISTTTATSASMKIDLQNVSPAVLQPHQGLTLSGVLQSPALTTAAVQLKVLTRAHALSSRENLTTLHSDPPTGLYPIALDPAASRQPNPNPEGQASFTLVIPPTALPYRKFGAYPLQIRADHQGHTTQLTIPVVWQPNSLQIQPTRLGWLWPIMDTPNQSVVNSLGGTTLHMRADPQRASELAEKLSGQNRLHQLVEVLRQSNNPRGVSVVLDPALMQSVTLLAQTRVGSPGPNTSPPSPDDSDTAATDQAEAKAAASQWLAKLDSVSDPSTRTLVPYADPDMEALIGNEQGTLVRQAIRRSIAMADKGYLATSESPNAQLKSARGWMIWPSDGYLSPTAAEVTANYDPENSDVPLRGIVLADTAVQESPLSTVTAEARGELELAETSLPLLRADSVLSELVSRPANNADSNHTAVVIFQQFLAHTAMISAEQPTNSRTIFIGPSHRFSPDSQLTSRLLALSNQLAWLEPTTAEQALQQSAAEKWKPLPTGRSMANAQLPAPYLDQLHQSVSDADDFISLLSVPEPTASTLRDATLRLTSSALRAGQTAGAPGNPAAAADRREQALQDLNSDLHTWREKVSIHPSSATLGAREGPIPISLINQLDQPVRVKLRLDPALPRVNIAKQAPLITAASGRRTQVNVRVKAVANGPVDLIAQLKTPAGKPYGPPATLPLRVRTVGPLGLLLTFGTGTLFIVAAFTRTIRRRLFKRHTPISVSQ